MVLQPKVPKSYTAPLHKVLQQYSMVIGMNFYLCYCPIDEITKTNKKTKTNKLEGKTVYFLLLHHSSSKGKPM